MEGYPMKSLQITTIVSLFILLFSSCATDFNSNNNNSLKQANLDTSDKVSFPVSCSKNTQIGIEQALTLVHHMMYVEAEKEFIKLSQAEPECAMTHWGIAMTLFHPLWPGQTRDAALQKAWAAIQKAKAIKVISQRELAYINAIEALYKNWESVSQKNRIASWAIAQKKLYQQFPDDTEAAVFYALSHLATAPKGDRSFSHQQQAGALLEKLHKKNSGKTRMIISRI